MNKNRWKGILLAALLLCLALAGCENDTGVTIGFLQSGETEDAETESADTGFRIMTAGEYDSRDTAVVAGVSLEDNKITLLNHIVNKYYTLRYDGLTAITDQYGEAMSAAQLSPGDIVDVTFQRIPKKCVSISLSPSAWEREADDGFMMNQARGQLSFKGELYMLAERMVLLSEGEEIELTDLNERDVLNIKGIDNTIYSILVEKGHGYLRLEGAEYFIGGSIEIGQKMVHQITEDMLLTVPEGEYNIVVRNGSHGGSRRAAIYRDEETVLDISDLKGEEVKTGRVFFTLTPVGASVYIDGEKIDTSSYVTLEYGIHQMIVTADGYETISQYLRVGQENANLDVEMEPDGEAEEEAPEEDEDGAAAEENAVENEGADEGADAREGIEEIEPSGEVSADGIWHVKINAPVDAEVYLDGNYIGLAPTSFPKQAGSHVISLRKSGYQTRSYTIQVDEEEKDMELSFSELVAKTDNTDE